MKRVSVTVSNTKYRDKALEPPHMLTTQQHVQKTTNGPHIGLLIVVAIWNENFRRYKSGLGCKGDRKQMRFHG